MHILEDHEMENANNLELAHALLLNWHNRWATTADTVQPTTTETLIASQTHALLALAESLQPKEQQ